MTLYDRGVDRSGNLIVPAISPYQITLTHPVLRGTMLINGYTEVEVAPREGQYTINYTDTKKVIIFNEANANAVLNYKYKDYGSDIKASDINIALGRISIVINLNIGESQLVIHNLEKLRPFVSTWQRGNGSYYAYYGMYRWFLVGRSAVYVEFIDKNSIRVINLTGSANVFELELF